MSLDAEKPSAAIPRTVAPLSQALDQSERVQDKVEQAAVDLSSVNAQLKEKLADRGVLTDIEPALNKSEAVEIKVQEAASELVAVNDALAAEIDERQDLERQLTESDAALAKSRAEEMSATHSALHDAVTGLPNLTLFGDRLRNGIAQAQRHGWRLAVMFIDLDGFKRVNDSHGHDLGDVVLKVVARRLQSIVRAGDTVSRRSGDEFLLLMLEAKDDAAVLAFAARVVQSIAEPCEIDGLTLTVAASVGVALYPDDGRSATELLKHADLAMYAAKRKKTGG